MNERQSVEQLAEHFFREEYTKIVAVVSRFLSMQNLNLAEDVAQDTLLEAIRKWEFDGIPPNPKAWLYTVAKNKALNLVKHGEVHLKYEREAIRTSDHIQELQFDDEVICDQQLKMIFVCCHPALSEDAQIVLALKNLCGFSIEEIACAFMSPSDTINKRLVRARKTLRSLHIEMDISINERNERLDQVLDVLYLIFNEGYYASQGEKVIRYDLCLDAIRLTKLLEKVEDFARHNKIHALLAMMYFNTARFTARQDEDDLLLDLSEQDRSLWDQHLIAMGIEQLEKVPIDSTVSRFQLMAAISAEHCVAQSFESTRWINILELYDRLVAIDNSPIVHLNRSIALARAKGVESGIQDALALETQLSGQAIYHCALAMFNAQMGQKDLAFKSYRQALKLTKHESQRRSINRKLEALQES